MVPRVRQYAGSPLAAVGYPYSRRKKCGHFSNSVYRVNFSHENKNTTPPERHVNEKEEQRGICPKSKRVTSSDPPRIPNTNPEPQFQHHNTEHRTLVGYFWRNMAHRQEGVEQRDVHGEVTIRATYSSFPRMPSKLAIPDAHAVVGPGTRTRCSRLSDD